MKYVWIVPLLASLAFAAQDPKPQEAPPKPSRPPGKFEFDPSADPRKELEELFKTVERKLQGIDRLLYDAGAGGKLGGPVEDGGIDRLLKKAGEESRDVQQGIDRILELARQMNQQQSSSSSSSGSHQQGGEQQSGGSPLDRQQGDQRQQRDQNQGQAPRAPGEKGDTPEQKPSDGSTPKNPRDSKSPPEQRTGGEAPKGPTERVGAGDDKERWGELPQYARDVFRVEGGGDLPPQYRDWIDAYYKRLAKRP